MQENAPATSDAAPASPADTLAQQTGMDPTQLMGMAQVLKRLPKGQLQRLQALMMQAARGKDVSREMAELQGTLPPDIQQMFLMMGQASMAAQSGQQENPEAPKKEGVFKRLFGR